MKKTAHSVSIIGGADGPTSIFLAGKDSNQESRMLHIKHSYQRWIYRRKRKRAITQIKAQSHSLPETVQYFTKQYHAVEKDCASPIFEERNEHMRYLLIQREKPELIGADKTIDPPADMDFQKEELLMQWVRKRDAWNKNCIEQMKKLPEHVFPMHYHLYMIACGKDGEIEIETEDVRGIMGISSSGNCKKLRKIVKDIYLYYGVTQEDIDNSTDRFQFLLSELSQ